MHVLTESQTRLCRNERDHACFIAAARRGYERAVDNYAATSRATKTHHTDMGHRFTSFVADGRVVAVGAGHL